MAAIGAIACVHVIADATMIRTAVKLYFRHRVRLKAGVAVATRWGSRVVSQVLETTIPADARRKRIKNSPKSAKRAVILRAYGCIDGV